MGEGPLASTNHIADDDLVLHYYGEGRDHRAVEAHLSSCAACRERFGQLSRDLESLSSLEVPERGEAYGAQVWARLGPELERLPARRRSAWLPTGLTWPRLAFAGGIAGLVLVAFVAGHSWRTTPVVPVQQAAADSPGVVKERVLLVAVGQHLERSRIVLAEISNQPSSGPVGFGPERANAENLVAANRLYRQTALSSGDAAVASVLDDLERVLVEIANSPDDATGQDVARLRQRIESQGLLFKVTVLGTQVSQRQRKPAVSTLPLTRSAT
jgi:hypothetical protein